MSKILTRQIEVHAHWVGLPQAKLMGVLQATVVRGREIFSFEYDEDWLKGKDAHALDPSLQLLSGAQYAPQGQINFGVFLDSAPDRWGRFLMDRRQAQLARETKVKEHKLLELDYLLGVYDAHRMGALRFRLSPSSEFLDNNKTYAAPPWTILRELEHASFELEKKDAESDPNYSKWLQMLIAPGSSLGGARPKASVIDENGHQWIAKFPSANDNSDIGAWEMVVNYLAQKAGINTALARVQKFNGYYHTFLSKRFDRNMQGERIHFASAMTLLQRSDGDDASLGVSYLELAEFIIQSGAHVSRDLEQLWRRIVFFVCVSNVDDHLRNHGFLLTAQGWVLAPAYDMNPVASGDGLRLNISETDNALDLNLVLEVADYFRVKQVRALQIVQEVTQVVMGWRQEATRLKIPAQEQEKMARAFSQGVKT